MKGIIYLLPVLLIALFFSLSFGFDKSILSELLTEEIKKSTIDKEVQIGQIKFIGLALSASPQENATHFEPKGNCIPENLKIREIKRPSSIEFTFYCGRSLYRAIANYEVLIPLYVTQRNLRRGDKINEEDIIEIKHPLSRIPSGALTDKNSIIGKIVKKTVAKGVILKEEHIYQGIPVKKGSRVNLIINAGHIMVITEGILKSDATVGGNVRVQCFHTGKEVEGKLIDKDKVRVSL